MPKPTSRNLTYDVLRAAAILRIFLWHGTGWVALTWIPAIPIMFYLSGRFMATTCERVGVTAAVRRRIWRLMGPYWLFAGIAVGVMYLYGGWRLPNMYEAVAWVFPIHTPAGAPWQGGWVVEPLWYIRTYTWILLTAVITYVVVRRWAMRGTLVMAVGAWIFAAWAGRNFWAVQDYLLGSVCFMAGLQAGRAGRSMHKGGILMAAVGIAGVFVAGDFTSWNVNENHGLQLSLGLLFVAGIETWTLRREGRTSRNHDLDYIPNSPIRRAVASINDRSLSIYLWHSPLIGLSYLLVSRVLQGWMVVAGALVVAALAVFIVVVLVGWVEDLGAGRAVSWSAVRDAAIAGAAGLVLVSAIVSNTTAANVSALPPIPSQAPPAAGAFADGVRGAGLVLDPQAADNIWWMPHLEETSDIGDGGASESEESLDKTPETVDGDKVSNEVDPFVPDRNEAEVSEKTTAAPALTPIGTWPSLGEEDPVSKEVVESLIREWILENKRGGVEVALVQPGKRRLTTAVDSDGSVVAVREEIPLASITKTFTAALLLRAVDSGLLDINQPIGELKVAPWFTLSHELTVAQIMSHRSGLVNYTETSTWAADWRDIDGWESALRASMKDGLRSTPGTVVSYSSTNYIVAGLVAAQLYGLDIEDLIERDLLNPLRLDTAEVGRPVPGSPGTGTGNMRANIQDVARWGVALWRDKAVLGPRGNQWLHQIDPSSMIGYGSFAWCPCRGGGTQLRWSSIGANGAEATVRYYPALDLVIAMRLPGGVDMVAEELILDIVAAIGKTGA